MATAFGSFVAGNVLTAADLNAAGGAWSTFTPSWTNFTLGNGTVNKAVYEQIGRSVDVKVLVTLGSTSSVTGEISLTLPVTAATAYAMGGLAWMYDTSGSANFVGFVQMASTTLAKIVDINVAGTYPFYIGMSGTLPFGAAWTTGDKFEMHMRYDAAANGT